MSLFNTTTLSDNPNYHFHFLYLNCFKQVVKPQEFALQKYFGSIGSSSGVLFGQIIARRDAFVKLLTTASKKRVDPNDIVTVGERYLSALFSLVFRAAQAQAVSPAAEAVVAVEGNSGTATLVRPSAQESSSNDDSLQIVFSEARDAAAAARLQQPFCWSGGMCATDSSSTAMGSSDPLFEYCCVLWNVLVSQMNAAQEKLQNERYKDEKKNTYKLLIEIACGWAFLEQKCQSLQNSNNDLKIDAVRAMKQITHAQALELALYIAMGNALPGGEQNTKYYETLCRLSLKIVELYVNSSKLLDFADQSFKDFLLYKSNFFLALAHAEHSAYLCSTGIDQGGAGVAAAQYAIKIVKDEFQPMHKSYSKTLQGSTRKDLLQQDFESLYKLVERLEDKARRENQMVFRQPVPEQVPTLLDSQSMGVIAAEEWTIPKDDNLQGEQVRYIGPATTIAAAPAAGSGASQSSRPQNSGYGATEISAAAPAQQQQQQEDPSTPMLEGSSGESKTKRRSKKKKFKCEILQQSQLQL